MNFKGALSFKQKFKGWHSIAELPIGWSQYVPANQPLSSTEIHKVITYIFFLQNFDYLKIIAITSSK